jgi:hypothetical protein
MAVFWGSAQQVPPGLFAKAGTDDSGDWHILMSSNESNILNSRSVGHDHYWKRGGQWYVQIRLTPAAMATPSDNKGHLFGPDRLFEECLPENLDNLYRQLVES